MVRRAASLAVILLLVAGGMTAALMSLGYHWNWAGVWTYRAKFVQGWCLTLALAAGSLVLSLGVGVGIALLRRSPWRLLRDAAMVFVELVRGTPLLVQILVLYYGLFESVHFENRHLAGVVILSLFAGAYVSEIVRAGIESVAASQWESARAIGLTPAQIYRFVIAPQAARAALPPLTGQFVSLIKDSSLLSVIAVGEFTQQAQEVHSFTYGSFESYLPLAAGYLLLTLPLSLVSRALERRLRYEA